MFLTDSENELPATKDQETAKRPESDEQSDVSFSDEEDAEVEAVVARRLRSERVGVEKPELHDFEYRIKWKDCDIEEFIRYDKLDCAQLIEEFLNSMVPDS